MASGRSNVLKWSVIFFLFIYIYMFNIICFSCSVFNLQTCLFFSSNILNRGLGPDVFPEMKFSTPPKNGSVEKIVTYRDHGEEVAAIVIHQQSGQTLNTSRVVTFEGDLGGQWLRGWCFSGNSNNKCSLLISVKT